MTRAEMKRMTFDVSSLQTGTAIITARTDGAGKHANLNEAKYWMIAEINCNGQSRRESRYAKTAVRNLKYADFDGENMEFTFDI